MALAKCSATVDSDAEVVVIGGGITGCGVARDLALRGVDVTVIERNQLAAGTTSRMHGLLHSGARYAVTDPETARHCRIEQAILKRIAPACINETGGMFVRHPEDPPGYLDTLDTACTDLGISTTRIDAATARDREPALTQVITAALTVPDATVDPLMLTAATAADARDHGARFRSGTAVVDLHCEDGDVTAVAITSEDDSNSEDLIMTQHVVNATGAWVGRIGAMAGVTIPTRLSQGAMVLVDAPSLRTVINRCRRPSDGDIGVPHAGGALLGTTDTAIDGADAISPARGEVGLLRTELGTVLPAVTEADRRRSSWGVRPLAAPTGGGNGRSVTRTFTMHDHAQRDGIGGLTTILGGKLTTYRRMGEAVADHVCDRLGRTGACETADRILPAQSDPETLADLYERFDMPIKWPQ